jgi:hypothetical protein
VFPGAKLIRLVPDNPGSGGMKTSVHSHQASPLVDTYNVFNCYVVNGRWRKAKAPSAIGTNQTSQSYTFEAHVFSTYDLSNPIAAATNYLLTHNYDGAENTIWNNTTGAVIYTTTNPSLPATFLNIKNRCFFGMGSDAGQITDGAASYKIGVDPPETAPTYTLSGASTYSGVWTLTGSPFIAKQSPSPAWTGGSPPSGDLGRTITVNGSSYTIDAVDTFSATAGTGTIDVAAGALTGTVNVAWPANGAYGGLLVTIGGDSALVGSYTISGTTTTVTFQTAITGAHSGAAYTLTGSRITLSANSVDTSWVASAVIFRGALTWTGPGPQYAYAWVDPLTGHVSNMSPIVYVTEEDQGGVTVTLDNIDSSAQPRFYATRIFRTLLSGGSVLYALTGGPGQAPDIGYTYKGYFINGSTIVRNHAANSGNIAVTNGSPNVHWVSAGSPFDGTYVGDTFDINGNTAYTVLSVTDGTHLVLTSNVVEATGTYGGGAVLSTPSRYNLDEATGYAHGGTSGPVTFAPFITNPMTVQGVAPIVDFIVDSGSSTTALVMDQAWGGTTGYYFFTVDSGPGTLQFVDTYDNSFLNPLLPGPIDTNFPPTIDDENAKPAHMAYWKGRLWINPTQAPWSIIYSGDEVQILVGVAEESFPIRNSLAIANEDNRVMGMKVIGPYLVITTEKQAYYVAGYNETNFALLPFASTMYGVGDKQMAELPADTGDSSNVVYLGRDKKLYVLAPGTGAISLSEPISDQISGKVITLADYQSCRVHVAHVEQRRLAILRIPGQCLAYDLERKVWTQFTPNGVIPESFTTLYGTSRPVTEIYGYHGALFEWQTEDATTANQVATISTFSSGFTDTKGKKHLNYIRLYVSSYDQTNAKPWTLTIAVDDKTNSNDEFTLSALDYVTTVASGPPVEANCADIYTLYPTGSVPIDGSGAKELIAFPQRALLGDASTPTGQAIEGFRFYIIISWPDDTVNRDLFAADICLTEIQDDRSVEP